MIPTNRHLIAHHAARLAAGLPPIVIHDLADALMSIGRGNWSGIRQEVLHKVPQPRFYGQIDEFLSVWQREASEVSAEDVALTILSAAAAVEDYRNDQSVQLVWTGPGITSVPMRRTDQALLQVINSAESDLLIVSFAVYNIGSVVQALIEAGRRGVRLRICLEAPEPGGQQMAYDTVRALGQEVGHLAQLYIWPRSNRPVSASGKPASLHAKCAVADGHLLFISSANLTEYAIALNMELGVLITDGDLPRRALEHFDRLIELGILQRTGI